MRVNQAAGTVAKPRRRKGLMRVIPHEAFSFPPIPCHIAACPHSKNPRAGRGTVNSQVNGLKATPQDARYDLQTKGPLS